VTGLVVLEAMATAAAAVYLLVELALVRPGSVATTVALAVLALLFAAGLLGAATALSQSRAWSRSAILVWQLLQLAVGISALAGSGGQPWIGWPLIGVAVLVVVLLFTPPVIAWSSDRRPRS